MTNIAAVVTVAFWAEDSKGITIALRELMRLQIGRVILVYDRNGQGITHTLAALEGFSKEFEDVKIALEGLPVDEDDTTLRWRRGVLRALEEPSIDAVFVFPSDFETPPTDQAREGWREMVDQATSNGLILGDYLAKTGSFKNNFEELVGLAVVEAYFPEEVAKLKSTGLRRIRTEFFVLGRGVLQRVRAAGTIWTLDPTIDLILACLRSPDLAVSVVDIDFLDDDSRRDPIGQFLQMTRFCVMLALNMIRLTPRETDPAKQIVTYDALRSRLEEGFAALINGIDHNREALLEQPIGNSRIGSSRIDNSKIKGVSIEWKEFRGFTVLMNNPGEVSPSGDLARVWGDVHHDPRLRFYAALARACERLRMRERFLRFSLCLVRPETYHCTLADGVHSLNINQIHDSLRPDFQNFLQGLPSSLLSGLPDTIPPQLYDDQGGWRVRFRFKRLSFPENDPLLARLEPADDESRERYQWLLGQRKMMDDALVALGKHPLGTWNPHITLGYGAVRSLAADLRPYLREWETAIREETEGEAIEYSGYAVAGFLDMTQYFMIRRPR